MSKQCTQAVSNSLMLTSACVEGGRLGQAVASVFKFMFHPQVFPNLEELRFTDQNHPGRERIRDLWSCFWILLGCLSPSSAPAELSPSPTPGVQGPLHTHSQVQAPTSSGFRPPLGNTCIPVPGCLWGPAMQHLQQGDPS